MRRLAVLCLVGLTSCGPGMRVAKVDAPTAAELDTTIRVFPGADVPANAKLVGPVEGTSCKLKAWDPTPSNEKAIQQVKFMARERGGNAIAAVNCEPPLGTNLGKNCWSSIRCTALAYSVQG